MEFADGGDLFQVVKKHTAEKKYINEDLIWSWILQMLQGVRYIHSKKIIHRDIKCQNIFLLKSGQIKLGDFGISKVLMDSFDFAKTPLGTPYFLSPEICSGSKYNFKIDKWMLGCVIYELASLNKPFEATTLPDLMKKIREKEVLPIPKLYSDELKLLISKLLCKEPNGRPSIKEVLQYDFIQAKMKKFGFEKFYNNWDECPDENAPNEDSPNHSLFDLGYGDLNNIYNISANAQVPESKKEEKPPVEGDNKKKPVSFGERAKQHLFKANFNSAKMQETISSSTKGTTIEIYEFDEQKKTPSQVVKDENLTQISLKYKFLKSKYGEEKTKNFISCIENEKADMNKLPEIVGRIFGDQGGLPLALGKLIIEECYGKS